MSDEEFEILADLINQRQRDRAENQILAEVRRARAAETELIDQTYRLGDELAREKLALYNARADEMEARGLLREARRPHFYLDEDTWYSCSQALDDEGKGLPGAGCADSKRSGNPCDCGADVWNARIDAFLARGGGLRAEQAAQKGKKVKRAK